MFEGAGRSKFSFLDFHLRVGIVGFIERHGLKKPYDSADLAQSIIVLHMC